MNKVVNLAILDDYEGVLTSAPATARLREIAEVAAFNRRLDDDELVNVLYDCHIAVAIRERTRFAAPLLERLPTLELLIQTGSHAYHIDLETATRRGLLVALDGQARASTHAVSELTFGLAIALLRNLPGLTHSMADGEWPHFLGRSLYGRTLGVLGLGRQGIPAARLGRAFGMRVVAWGPTLTQERAEAERVEYLELDELLSCADVVTIHLRLSEQSRGLLDHKRIALMRPDAILINTARGEIVDEAALAEALAAGQLAGAGLDVYSCEPLSPDSPLRRLPNVVLTPHIGWTVDAVFEQYSQVTWDTTHAYLRGVLPVAKVCNPEALNVARQRHGGVCTL
jgi:D-3-phosphoglycerate dehydrogenase / 2-oxoglutarate reductase